MQATISGRCSQTIASVISIVSCRAPTARATAAAAARSSAAPGAANPAVKASTSWLVRRRIIASTAELSMPPERKMP